MSDEPVVRLLTEIRDAQKLQVARQDEALKLQREQFAIFQRQAERAERLQDRAEKMQDKSAQVIGTARKALFVVLPILILLIGYVSWLMFR
jgi:hypothetical protein